MWHRKWKWSIWKIECAFWCMWLFGLIYRERKKSGSYNVAFENEPRQEGNAAKRCLHSRPTSVSCSLCLPAIDIWIRKQPLLPFSFIHDSNRFGGAGQIPCPVSRPLIIWEGTQTCHLPSAFWNGTKEKAPRALNQCRGKEPGRR